eukprot:scaffold32782_cov16-Tisochrysis_lutea.AAC.1
MQRGGWDLLRGPQPLETRPLKNGPLNTRIYATYAYFARQNACGCPQTRMREPAADLAIAVAIVSGYYSIAVPRDMVVIGEVRYCSIERAHRESIESSVERVEVLQQCNGRDWRGEAGRKSFRKHANIANNCNIEGRVANTEGRGSITKPSTSCTVHTIPALRSWPSLQIDLGGGLRPVKSLDTRLAEVAKLGIKSAVIPKVCAAVHGLMTPPVTSDVSNALSQILVGCG